MFADLDEEFSTAPKKKPAAAGLAAKAAAAATQPKAAKGESEVSILFVCLTLYTLISYCNRILVYLGPSESSEHQYHACKIWQAQHRIYTIGKSLSLKHHRIINYCKLFELIV